MGVQYIRDMLLIIHTRLTEYTDSLGPLWLEICKNVKTKFVLIIVNTARSVTIIVVVKSHLFHDT